MLADDCFNGGGYNRSPRVGVEISEELLLPFEHYVVQVLIVGRLRLHLRLAVGVFRWRFDLVLNGVKEEGALAGLNMRRWDQLFPVEAGPARLHMRLERVLPHPDLRRQLPILVSKGTLDELERRRVMPTHGQAPSVVWRRVWLKGRQLLLRYGVHLFYFS